MCTRKIGSSCPRLFEPLMTREKEYYRHETRYVTADGGYRWIEVHAWLTLDEKNRTAGLSGTLTDISERKRAEEIIRESEESLRTILRSVPSGILIAPMGACWAEATLLS